MSILEQLGVALGLATLAGVNLYLTVLLVGVAIRFDLLHLAEQYHNLEVLSHPAVLAIAGVFFIMEFLADKVPWLDTLWDSVHTFIRPIGGTLLGLQALGDMPAYMEVVAGLIAGGAALTTHGVKSGSRLIVNHSPEPVSNVTLSVTEDAAVVGGVALTLLHPVVGLIVFSSILIICWLIFPRVWRGTKATIRLAWYKLQMPGRRQPLISPVTLPRRMNDTLRDMLLYRGDVADEDVQSTVPCLTGKSKGVKGMSPNLNGILVLTHSSDYVYFMASKGLRDRLFRIPLNGSTAQIESKFLSENLMVEQPGMKAVFRFPRGEGDIAETIALRLNEAKTLPAPTTAVASAPVSTDVPEVKLQAETSAPASVEPEFKTAPKTEPEPEVVKEESKTIEAEILPALENATMETKPAESIDSPSATPEPLSVPEAEAEAKQDDPISKPASESEGKELKDVITPLPAIAP